VRSARCFLVVAVVALGIFSGLVVDLAGQPKCVTPTAVPVKDNLFDFRYDSYVKPEGQTRFLFQRAIQSADPKVVMYADWEKTGVRGLTHPEDGCLENDLPQEKWTPG